MKGRYDSIIEQGDNAGTSKERQDCSWIMLKTIGTNHLPTIEGKINKLMWLIGALILATLFSSKDSISWLWMAVLRLF